MNKKWLRRAAFGMLSVFVSAAPPARAQEYPVAARTLKNGMKVLVQTDHSIPNVALYIFYRIGSRNERPGTTGLSHFFEHMMFNGAKKYGPGELDKVMEAQGGSNNAYTTQNVTVYQDWFPRAELPLIFDIEADRIRDLNFDLLDSGVLGVLLQTAIKLIPCCLVRLIEQSFAIFRVAELDVVFNY